MNNNKSYKAFSYALSPLLILSLTYLVIPMPKNTFGQNTSRVIECISIEDNGTSVAGSSPSPNVIPPISNETSQGFSNITDVEKSTGSNFAILVNNKNIGDPSVSLAEGLEKSQLGNRILGNQTTIFEGDILRNISDVCWQK